VLVLHFVILIAMPKLESEARGRKAMPVLRTASGVGFGR
jgi:hypothetical protein